MTYYLNIISDVFMLTKQVKRCETLKVFGFCQYVD